MKSRPGAGRTTATPYHSMILMRMALYPLEIGHYLGLFTQKLKHFRVKTFSWRISNRFESLEIDQCGRGYIFRLTDYFNLK